MSPAARRTGPGPRRAPSLREERKLLRTGHRWLAAIDEVGRGALAGPVTVGVVVVDEQTRSAPAGVRDSKLLTPQARVAIAPRLRRWAPMHAVGHASSYEIDAIGIIAALRLAASRALGSLPVRPDCALLDGSHNWLSLPVTKVLPVDEAPQTEELFALPPAGSAPVGPVGEPESLDDLVRVRPELLPPRVVTQVKADLRCAAVAAASVLAKVERDAIMVELAGRHPGYGWELNKGYSAPEHLHALRRLGPSALHRRSWNLPGQDDPQIEELDLGLGVAVPAAAEQLDPMEADGSVGTAGPESVDELKDFDEIEDDGSLFALDLTQLERVAQSR